MQWKSISCAADFSDFSIAAYEYALSLAQYYGAMLAALHVVELWKFPFADCAAGPDGRHRLRRILYCTDFSNNSEPALSCAISLAAEYGGELTLFEGAEKLAGSARAKAINAERTQELDKLVTETEGKMLVGRAA